jgi:hypothetical protein
MDINVLKQVKKKGPKKLRGPAAAAAAAAKRRIARKEKAPYLEGLHPSDIYWSFTHIRMEDMEDRINRFLLKLSALPNKTATELRSLALKCNLKLPRTPLKKELIELISMYSMGNKEPILSYENPIIGNLVDPVIPKPELVWMFQMLKTQIPWTLVKPFFEAFRNSGRDNIVTFFEEFYNRQSTRDQVLEMNTLLRKRAIEGSKAEKNTWVGSLDEWVIKARKKYEQIPVFKTPNLENPRERVIPMFGSGDIMSKCEREYRRAPWMTAFTTDTVRGFVVKNVPLLEKYMSSEYEDGWFNVGKAWYKDACDGKRRFVEGDVGYKTVTGKIIVETIEMFNASIRELKKDIDNKFQIVTPHSFSVAKEMLEQNRILPKPSIQGILASINPTTNHDMARGLSKILVYLQPLIQGGRQIHHFRIKNSYYNPEDIINLDRYTVLPEIYKNPNSNHDEAENIIKRKRAIIENEFYNALSKPFDPFVRKNVVAKQNIFKYLQTDARDSCPSGIDDVIYYNEDGKIYCFDRVEIIDKEINPFTGKKFRQDFFNELNKIEDVFYDASEIQPDEPVNIPVVKPPIELAPGLFQKLRAMLQIIHCNQCDREIHSPQYKTVQGTERLYFCSRQCFEDFIFG